MRASFASSVAVSSWRPRRAATKASGSMSARSRRGVRGGGPRLDVDEWTLLMHCYLVNGAVPLPPDHAHILAISPTLSRLAIQRGTSRRGQTLRSAPGLSRRIGVLRSLARGEAKAAPKAARHVYELYANEPVACASRAASLLDTWDASDAKAQILIAPARGPHPSDGVFQSERTFDPMAVYLFVLDGPDSVVRPVPSCVNPARCSVEGARLAVCSRGWRGGGASCSGAASP